MHGDYTREKKLQCFISVSNRSTKTRLTYAPCNRINFSRNSKCFYPSCQVYFFGLVFWSPLSLSKWPQILYRKLEGAITQEKYEWKKAHLFTFTHTPHSSIVQIIYFFLHMYECMNEAWVIQQWICFFLLESTSTILHDFWFSFFRRKAANKLCFPSALDSIFQSESLHFSKQVKV